MSNASTSLQEGNMEKSKALIYARCSISYVLELMGGYLMIQVGVMNLFRFCSLVAIFALVLFLLAPSTRNQGVQIPSSS